MNSGSGLMQSFLIATGATAILFLAMTIIPFYLDKAERQKAAENAPQQAPAENTVRCRDMPVPEKKTEPETVAKKNPPTPAELKKNADKLKENGVKTGKPSLNPLDKKDDDLFKD